MNKNVVVTVLLIVVAGCSVVRNAESPLGVWNSKDAPIEKRASAAREIAPTGLNKGEVFRRLNVSPLDGHWSRFNDWSRNGDALYYFLLGFPDGDVAFLFEQDGSEPRSTESKLLRITVSRRLRPLLIKGSCRKGAVNSGE